MSTVLQRGRRAVSRVVPVPPRDQWPYALPGLAELHELRWRRLLARTPAVTVEEHAAQTGVGEIEEVIGCSLCDGRRVQPLFEPHAGGRGQAHYHVVRCVGCGLLFRHPGIRPERLGDLYAGSYGKFLTGAYERKRRRRYRLAMEAFGPALADGAGRRLLDFGCGAGLFLELAHDRGFDAHGVDLSEDAVTEARKRPSGRNAYFGTPRDVPEIAAGGFDVVTLWSVLAHLATPVEDLAMLRDLLTDDGMLLILTVNANSVRLKADRDGWNGFTPNHLKFYAPATLPLLLRRAGFGAAVLRPTYGDTIEAGTSALTARQQQRVRRTIDRGNRGNMLRALAFVDPDGPRRLGLDRDAVRL